MRRRRVGRLNRPLLVLLGLVLAVSGALGLLWGTAVLPLPGPPPSAAVLPPTTASLLAEPWAPLAVGGAGVLLALLGVGWLLAQLPWAGAVTPFRLHEDPADGVIECQPEVLAEAVREQVAALPGVHRAEVEVAGSAHRSSVALRVTVNERAQVADVVRRISTEVVQDLSIALDHPVVELAGRVESTPAVRSASTVVVPLPSGPTEPGSPEPGPPARGVTEPDPAKGGASTPGAAESGPEQSDADRRS